MYRYIMLDLSCPLTLPSVWSSYSDLPPNVMHAISLSYPVILSYTLIVILSCTLLLLLSNLTDASNPHGCIHRLACLSGLRELGASDRNGCIHRVVEHRYGCIQSTEYLPLRQLLSLHQGGLSSHPPCSLPSQSLLLVRPPSRVLIPFT